MILPPKRPARTQGRPSPAPLASAEVVMVDLDGPVLLTIDGEHVASVVALCNSLEIPAGPELARLGAAPWSGLREVLVPGHGGSFEPLTIVGLPAARLWLATMDARLVGPGSRRWLLSQQADVLALIANDSEPSA